MAKVKRDKYLPLKCTQQLLDRLEQASALANQPSDFIVNLAVMQMIEHLENTLGNKKKNWYHQ